jgi:hypothetical protein
VDKQIVKRNLDLVSSVTRFILAHPSILDRLPPDFRLVVLPEDDRELSQYNLDLLSKHADPSKPVVIVRVMAHEADLDRTPPQVYVPVAA